MRPALAIENYMTSVLIVIAPEQPIAEAARLMRLHGVRHLPVVRDGRVLGLLSQRDVYLIETLRDVDPQRVRVEEAMTTDVYAVEPEESVVSVARHMADRRIGSAIVEHNGKLLGLFTTTDSLRALAALALASHVEDPEAAPRASR